MAEKEPIYQTTPAPAATEPTTAAAPYEVSYVAEQSADFWAQVKTLLLRIQEKYPTMLGGVEKQDRILAGKYCIDYEIVLQYKKTFEGEEYSKQLFYKAFIQTESEVIEHLNSLL